MMLRLVEVRREARDRRKRGRVAGALGAALGVLAFSFALSMVHPWGDPWHDSGRDPGGGNAEILTGAEAPQQVKGLLESKCGDCHSQRTRLPWYGHLAPVSWIVERDVLEGREHLNLSRWQLYEAESQVDLLARIAAEVRSGRMAPETYLRMHPDARLNDEERQLLIGWTRDERRRIKQAHPARDADAIRP